MKEQGALALPNGYDNLDTMMERLDQSRTEAAKEAMRFNQEPEKKEKKAKKSFSSEKKNHRK